MRAELLTIGDELCRGEIVDTNSSYLAARLWDLDITTRWMTSCNDEAADIALALTSAVERADVVVCSGGLGPTEDDLTVDVVAKLAGVDAIVDEPAKQRMLERFGKMLATGQIPSQTGVAARRMTADAAVAELTRIQLRQVRVPAGARVHVNPAGLAPGFEVALTRGDGTAVPVVCLPGVPRELYSILDAGLGARLAELREASGDVERIARRIYRAFGRGESQVSQACRGLVDGVAGASIHYQVKFPETLVKLVVRDRDQAAATARLDAIDVRVRERLAGVIYGIGETESLVEKVTRRLIESATTVATAESCTGGLVGELLTRVPGSSKAFKGGAIVYTNDEKVRQLGVRPATLAAFGAVSEETVVEMARGALIRIGAHDAGDTTWPDGTSPGQGERPTGTVDLAVAVSGIAGPDGGTPDKPVGTAWIALAGYENNRPVSLATKRLAWPGARDQVRLLSAWWALKLIDDALDRRAGKTK